jgi:hypothetical protein
MAGAVGAQEETPMHETHGSNRVEPAIPAPRRRVEAAGHAGCGRPSGMRHADA